MIVFSAENLRTSLKMSGRKFKYFSINFYDKNVLRLQIQYADLLNTLLCSLGSSCGFKGITKNSEVSHF